MEIENLLNQNKELLNTFDKNNDGIIDHTEINSAVQKAKSFAEHVIKDKSVKEWFYYGQNRPVGPISWHEVIDFHKKYPDVFVSNEQNEDDEDYRYQWLPAKVIIQTIDILQNS